MESKTVAFERVHGFRFRVQGLELGEINFGVGFWILGLGFEVWGLNFWIFGSGFENWGCGLRFGG